MNFLSNLATNATEHDVGIVLYSGNNDGLIHHFSTEREQVRLDSSLYLQLTRHP